MTAVQSSVLRVLHWNVHSWVTPSGEGNVSLVGDAISATNPDVITLVEVDETTTGPLSLDVLAARLSYFSLFVPAFEYGEEAPSGQFGNAILSRTPFLDVRNHLLTWPASTYDGTEESEPRSLVSARVQSGIGPVWIGVTHLPRTDGHARHATAKCAISVMRGLAAPWLLAGDFNMDPASWTEVYSPFQVYPPRPAPTYPNTNPVEAVDYCITARSLVADVRRLDSSASDHLPILATVQAV